MIFQISNIDNNFFYAKFSKTHNSFVLILRKFIISSLIFFLHMKQFESLQKVHILTDQFRKIEIAQLNLH